MNIDRFLGLLLLDLSVSRQFQECDKKLGVTLIVFHHMVSVFLWCNFLLGFASPTLHTALLLLVVGLWFATREGGCFLTRIHNRVCGFKSDPSFSNIQGYVLGTKMSTHIALAGVLLAINFHLHRSGKTTLF